MAAKKGKKAKAQAAGRTKGRSRFPRTEATLAGVTASDAGRAEVAKAEATAVEPTATGATVAEATTEDEPADVPVTPVETQAADGKGCAPVFEPPERERATATEPAA